MSLKGKDSCRRSRIPYKWKNNPNAYPIRYLYLDLLAEYGDSDEGGEKYLFRFLTDEQAKPDDPKVCWFKVSDILGMQNSPPMLEWLEPRLPQDKRLPAFKVLDQLYRVIHDKHLISYYEEKSQDLAKVLNIFIRMNKGGTVLSYSDLLMSTAVAQWKGDARKEIHTLVGELNATGDGFKLSQDLVLKAGLMLAEIGNVGFKIENFNSDNMEILEKRWPDVKDSMKVAVQLLASFGFNEKTLSADSAILPIAYYLCHRKLDSSYIMKGIHAADRAAIRTWLTRSLLKASGIWGSGLDTLLTALREAIAKHGADGFPADKLQEVMSRRGRSLLFTDDEINELVEMQYGDNRLFAVLALLFPFVDVSRNHFHIDHIFPKSRFTNTKLKKAGILDDDIEEFQEMVNGLPNLQLLEGTENIEKLASLPADWIKATFPIEAGKTNYCKNHLLGQIPESLTEFKTFYTTRREALRSRIVEMVGAKKSDATAEAMTHFLIVKDGCHTFYRKNPKENGCKEPFEQVGFSRSRPLPMPIIPPTGKYPDGDNGGLLGQSGKQYKVFNSEKECTEAGFLLLEGDFTEQEEWKGEEK